MVTNKPSIILVETEEFKISRSGDKRYWIYEEWAKGGAIPGTNKKGDDHWNVIGYYGSLEDLAKYLLRRQMEVPQSTGYQQIKDLVIAIKIAETQIIQKLEVRHETTPTTS